MDLTQSPPEMAQRIHRHMRTITGQNDPYTREKDKFDRLALAMLPEMRTKITASADPLISAARYAIAGNVLDMGVFSSLNADDMFRAIEQVFQDPFFAEVDAFKSAVARANKIIYLCDNAGEIAFDRLLIEQLSPERVTAVVRGFPVINDATRADALTVELDRLVKLIDNGSDAPGTVLEDCSPEFRQLFGEADLVISKGQGNFESLSNARANIFFLFKVKCPVVADHVGQPLGTQMLISSKMEQGS